MKAAGKKTVKLDSGKTIEADAVIVATTDDVASDLLDIPRDEKKSPPVGTCCLYFK